MKRPRLTKDQNLALRNLVVEKKLALIQVWKKEGLITDEAFNHFSNHWLNKASRQGEKENHSKCPKRSRCKSIYEGEMTAFIEELQRNLNKYLANRRKENFILNDEEIAKIEEYLQKLFCYRDSINRLLIIGLRYPDKRLNKLCEEFIRTHRKDFLFQDFSFWQNLWEDDKFVPLDAVRLMMININGQNVIDRCFSPFLIKKLIPAIRFQRDKEERRLKWAESLEGSQKEREISRKQKRLKAFNTLLHAAKAYIH